MEMKNISKEFHGVRVLEGVDLRVYPGQVHAVCGENGAGKSTLIKILSGIYPVGDFGGEIWIEGEPKHFSNNRQSEKAGVAVIYQELSLIEEMSIAENIFLGREPASMGWIHWSKLYSDAQKYLKAIKLEIHPATPVRELGVGQKQQVEIAKALSKNAKILVLDEPTSALSEGEVETLLELIQNLKKSGVACILVSHKLNEVFEIADEVTVLRDGKFVSTRPSKETSDSQVVAEMVGRQLTQLYPYRSRKLGDEVFKVEGLTVENPKRPDYPTLKDITFSLRRGEILGISGLVGAGRTELLTSLFGTYPGKKLSGKVFIQGQEVHLGSPSEALKAKISLVTEDRKNLGLVLEQSVLKNITLASLKQFSKVGLIDSSQEISTAQRFAKNLRVKAASLEVPVNSLSGGNQQKVVLAKCLLTGPEILFLDEPTRGIDVGARAEIYQLLFDLAEKGLSVLMVSSDLPEVLGVCDRIIVFSQGRLTGEFNRGIATQEKIMQVATR